MVSIQTEEEHQYLFERFYDHADGPFWIGGIRDGDVSFIWSDGKPFDYVNWKAGDPNNWVKKLILEFKLTSSGRIYLILYRRAGVVIAASVHYYKIFILENDSERFFQSTEFQKSKSKLGSNFYFNTF